MMVPRSSLQRNLAESVTAWNQSHFYLCVPVQKTVQLLLIAFLSCYSPLSSRLIASFSLPVLSQNVAFMASF